MHSFLLAGRGVVLIGGEAAGLGGAGDTVLLNCSMLIPNDLISFPCAGRGVVLVGGEAVELGGAGAAVRGYGRGAGQVGVPLHPGVHLHGLHAQGAEAAPRALQTQREQQLHADPHELPGQSKE